MIHPTNTHLQSRKLTLTAQESRSAHLDWMVLTQP